MVDRFGDVVEFPWFSEDLTDAVSLVGRPIVGGGAAAVDIVDVLTDVICSEFLLFTWFLLFVGGYS